MVVFRIRQRRGRQKEERNGEDRGQTEEKGVRLERIEKRGRGEDGGRRRGQGGRCLPGGMRLEAQTTATAAILRLFFAL